MKRYELTTITLKEDEADKVSALITDLGGSIEERKDLGNRRFAYPIQKENSGMYTSFIINIDENKITELGQKIQKNSAVLRHLIIILKVVKKEFISKLSEELSKPVKEDSRKTATEEIKEVKEVKEEKTKKPIAETEETKEEPKVEIKEKTTKEDVKVEKIEEVKEEIKETKEEIKEEKKTLKEAKSEAKKEEAKEQKSEEEERLKKLNEKLDELLKD